LLFQIKICGITSVEDACAAIHAGADAIGLNFYEKSPRCVTLEQAQAVVAAVSGKAQCVGVFVNCDNRRIEHIQKTVSLCGVQLHGEEPPQAIAELQSSCVIRARRMDDRAMAAIFEDLAACKAAGRLPDAVLVDAMTPGQYGGTGKTVAWAELVDHPQELRGVPLILAGGLTPENVAEAIRTVRPHGVDVASGVESSPGVKDHAKMRAFVEAARSAFAEIEA